MLNKYKINYFIKLFKKYIIEIKIRENFLKIKLNNKYLNDLVFIFNFFKNHNYFRFNTLIDIICVDNLKYQSRFELNYILLSIDFNSRLVISFDISENFLVIPSLINLFSGADWIEREIFDMYGIYFLNHNDLRRILTDYGFDGYPLRKDFPLNGFFEIRYDENNQYLIYDSIELMQNMRVYNFNNPLTKKYML